MGAVILRHGKVISVGCNLHKTHPKSAKLAATVHAEHSAIIAAQGANLQGSTILVYRQDKYGQPALAKPCSNCRELLLAVGCKLMVYTTGVYPYFEVEKL